MSHPYHQHHHLQSERHNTIPSPLIASSISKVEQCSCCVKAWSITLLVITILGVLASASSLDRNTRLCEYDIDDCDDYEVIVVISAILSWISYAISISFAIKGIIASSRKTSHQANILKKWFKIWVITNVICIITSYGLYIYAVNVILQEAQEKVNSYEIYYQYRKVRHILTWTLIFYFVLTIGILAGIISCCYCCVDGLQKSVNDYEIRLRNMNQYSLDGQGRAVGNVMGNIQAGIPVSYAPSQIEMQDIGDQ